MRSEELCGYQVAQRDAKVAVGTTEVRRVVSRALDKLEEGLINFARTRYVSDLGDTRPMKLTLVVGKSFVSRLFRQRETHDEPPCSGIDGQKGLTFRKCRDVLLQIAPLCLRPALTDRSTKLFEDLS